jgi:chorismate mutase
MMSAPELEARREDIARIDVAIVELMAERLQAARTIGAAKRAAGAATLDPAQEAAVVRRAVEHARTLGLPGEPVRAIFWDVVRLCRDAQLEDRP